MSHLFWTGDYYNEGLNAHNLLFDKLGEECGVFGIWGNHDAAELCYYGLHALQHRGQESAGICTSDKQKLRYLRGMGLVKEVFTRETLDKLSGSGAIAHVRYSTAGESRLENAQPLVFNYRGGELSIATNGNIVNAKELKTILEKKGSIFQSTSDTEVVAHLIAHSQQTQLEDAIKEALAQITGAYAFLIMTKDKLIAASDPNGLRPFSIAKLGEAYLFASETCAFDAVGAHYLRDVHPGEMIVLGEGNPFATSKFAKPKQHAVCAMEYVYFARPDSDIHSINVHAARKRMGIRLAQEAFVDADVVIGVPDSSISAAIGYAEQTGIPYELGLIKNRYTGRTFIEATQQLREQSLKMKLSAVRKVVEGKRVVMIDDSIVRGTTSLRIVNLLREAGAKAIHVRISSPPFMNPCFYGIDTPTREDLIASLYSPEQICTKINADSLSFLSKEGMLEAIHFFPKAQGMGCCTACFDNHYPTDVPVGTSAAQHLPNRTASAVVHS